MTPEPRTREHPEATDPLREALALIAAHQPPQRSRAAWRLYVEAIPHNPAAQVDRPDRGGAMPTPDYSDATDDPGQARRWLDVPADPPYDTSWIERRRKAGEWEALPDA